MYDAHGGTKIYLHFVSKDIQCSDLVYSIPNNYTIYKSQFWLCPESYNKTALM